MKWLTNVLKIWFPGRNFVNHGGVDSEIMKTKGYHHNFRTSYGHGIPISRRVRTSVTDVCPILQWSMTTRTEDMGQSWRLEMGNYRPFSDHLLGSEKYLR